ncbi:ArnT family glycosyltransferase [Inmirania thermothiophila]|uniref:4-amino-4-deoxy-L-arabinose transferase-like glycosyltransferase n=1 Tax=Inmirania thermothiophila TaxID=1750597 RepID=A0A3N1Y8Q7_9GAMM|nr:glycosyltransferase family 39 protein [Inmirania thermothiophila]ROR34878.1 4-amino-4-deoxy-L-arabinose transferase-like glycosyltransferase [Inmirania thermothiophila]
MARAWNRERLGLLLLGLVVIGAGLGLRDPWPPDEPRFALVAKEMVESGQWLFPTRGGFYYADKPPLYFWLMALAYRLTGELRLAFLLPSLAAGLGTLLLVHDLGRRLWGRRAGRWAAMALLVSVQFPLQARSAQIDATLAFWTTLGLYGLARHLLLGPAWRWWRIGWAAMGFGVITKGVGFLPALALIPWGWAAARGWRRIARPQGGWLAWAGGPAWMLAAVGAWLVPMLLAVAASGDPALAAYRDEILFRQTADRYLEGHGGHVAPWWYLLVQVVPWAWLPLTAALPWLVPAWWRRLRRRDGRHLVLLGWVVLVLAFFSLAAGKRGVYILPALPALALAAAPLVPGLVRRVAVQRTAWAVLAGLGALFAGLLAWLHLVPGALDAVRTREHLDPTPPLAAFAALAAAALALGPRRGVAALAGFLLALWPAYGLVGYPALDPGRSTRPFMAEIGRRIGPRAELGLTWWKEQMVLLADRPVHAVRWRGRAPREVLAEAVRWQEVAPGRWLVVPEDRLAPCFDPARTVDLGLRHGVHWHLVGSEAATGRCRGGEVPG